MADLYECYSNLQYTYRELNNYWGEADRAKKVIQENEAENLEEAYEYFMHMEQGIKKDTAKVVLLVLQLVVVLFVTVFFLTDIFETRVSVLQKVLRLILLILSLPLYAVLRISELKKGVLF